MFQNGIVGRRDRCSRSVWTAAVHRRFLRAPGDLGVREVASTRKRRSSGRSPDASRFMEAFVQFEYTALTSDRAQTNSSCAQPAVMRRRVSGEPASTWFHVRGGRCLGFQSQALIENSNVPARKWENVFRSCRLPIFTAHQIPAPARPACRR